MTDKNFPVLFSDAQPDGPHHQWVKLLLHGLHGNKVVDDAVWRCNVMM